MQGHLRTTTYSLTQGVTSQLGPACPNATGNNSCRQLAKDPIELPEDILEAELGGGVDTPPHNARGRYDSVMRQPVAYRDARMYVPRMRRN